MKIMRWVNTSRFVNSKQSKSFEVVNVSLNPRYVKSDLNEGTDLSKLMIRLVSKYEKNTLKPYGDH